MRGFLEGLENPHRMGLALPAVYQEDDLTQRLTSALDDVLTPIVHTLDNLDAYLDPWLAPEDFLEWLSTWVGVILDESWPLDRKRRFVARAVDLYRLRGTVEGISQLVTLYAGVEPRIVESGGVRWAATPGADLPGRPEPQLTVKVKLPGSDDGDLRRIDAIVATAKPAHVPHRVEISNA